MTTTAFEDEVRAAELIMAPDGDAAFDDGSHVLQLDCGNSVRIIAFRNRGEMGDILTSSKHLMIDAADFYNVLESFVANFELEWLQRRSAT